MSNDLLLNVEKSSFLDFLKLLGENLLSFIEYLGQKWQIVAAYRTSCIKL